MRFVHPEHPDREVRLAYCLNLLPVEDARGVLRGLAELALPLRDRLAGGEPFGVGLYLPAAAARELAGPGGAAGLDAFVGFLAESGLEPFTCNAFPFGGFHREGLKAGVFRPTWLEPRRMRYTLDVARIAARAAVALRAGARGHVSISTHPGMVAADLAGPADRAGCALAFARCAAELARIEEESGVRVVLSIEPEPGASCGDTAELADLHSAIRGAAAGQLAAEASWGADRAREVCARHLGTCLDACHAAVEFEEPEGALARATAGGAPLGKLQISNALRLLDPGGRPRGRERLLALDEPVYLHQVGGEGPDGRLRAFDLPALGAALSAGEPDWLSCPEWRCHFHVPVDLGRLGEEAGLDTTRELADALLDRALSRPEIWGLEELHLEIETYTWSVLPGEARGAGDRLDGLEREYAHVLERLERAGWRRAAGR